MLIVVYSLVAAQHVCIDITKFRDTYFSKIQESDRIEMGQQYEIEKLQPFF